MSRIRRVPVRPAAVSQASRETYLPIPGQPVGLRLRSAQDVHDLIADLKDALKRSLRDGGQHPVYRMDEARRPLLLVEIHVLSRSQVPEELQRPGRRGGP